jgi:hypothetical protein
MGALPEPPRIPLEDVEVLRTEQWNVLDAALEREGPPFVAITVPGSTAGPDEIAAALPAFESERTAAVFVGMVGGDEPASPLTFTFRETRRGRYYPTGLPPRLVLMRRSACRGLVDPNLAELGAQAAILDLGERALADGWRTAYMEAPGLGASAAARVRGALDRWERNQARAALICRDTAATGGLAGARDFAVHGLVPRIRLLWRSIFKPELSVLNGMAGFASFFAGCLLAVGRRRPRRPT